MLNFGRSNRGFRLVLGLVASSLMLLTATAGITAAASPSSPRSGTATLGIHGDGAVRISPDPTIRHLREQPWDHITVSGNGKRLTVYFWMGPQACNGLGRVDVSRRDGQLDVQLWTGVPKHQIGLVCPEYAQLYKTIVHLKRPIVGNDL